MFYWHRLDNPTQRLDLRVKFSPGDWEAGWACMPIQPFFYVRQILAFVGTRGFGGTLLLLGRLCYNREISGEPHRDAILC